MTAAICGMGGWEVVMVLVALLLLLAIRRMADISKDGRVLDNVLRGLKNDVTLMLAQGFGAGRIPLAPGTFGSLLGLLWFFILLTGNNFWLFLAGLFIGVALAIPICGAAERVLQQHDPPSVVLDEIAAVPICFLPWVAAAWLRHQQMPSPESFLSG